MANRKKKGEDTIRAYRSTVTFRRGTTESRTFADWMKEVRNDKAPRKNIVVNLLDDEMQEVASWQLENAWPTRYSASDFNATSNEVAIESMEVVCEGITRMK